MGERFTITGKVDNDSKISELRLYKFHDMFSEEFVSSIPIIDDNFYFSADMKEVDAFVLKNPINRLSFLFVWDGDVQFLINEENFSYSKVLNSPLTRELRLFDSTRIANFIEPVKKIDSSIDNALKLKSSNVDSLKKERERIYTIYRKGFDSYTKDYIHKYPDSFISLLKLTSVNSIASSDEERKLMTVFSDTLKKHSRAKKFFGG